MILSFSTTFQEHRSSLLEVEFDDFKVDLQRSTCTVVVIGSNKHFGLSDVTRCGDLKFPLSIVEVYDYD